MIRQRSIGRALRFIGILLFLATFFIAGAQTPDDPKALDAAATRDLETAVSFVGKGDSDSLKSGAQSLTNSLSYSTRSGNLTLQANAHFMRAVCYHLLGSFEAAEGDAKKALELYTKLKDPMGQFLNSALLSVQYLKLKDDEKAKPYMLQAWELIKDGAYETLDNNVLKTIGSPYFSVLGNAFARFGDRKRGLDFLWKGYQLVKDSSGGEPIDALVRYSQAQVTLGTPAFGVSFLESALKRARTAKLRGKEAEVLYELGDLHLTELNDEAGRTGISH
jgi:tetratricopeptide (TPR) repeat protein